MSFDSTQYLDINFKAPDGSIFNAGEPKYYLDQASVGVLPIEIQRAEIGRGLSYHGAPVSGPQVVIDWWLAHGGTFKTQQQIQNEQVTQTIIKTNIQDLPTVSDRVDSSTLQAINKPISPTVSDRIIQSTSNNITKTSILIPLLFGFGIILVAFRRKGKRY